MEGSIGQLGQLRRDVCISIMGGIQLARMLKVGSSSLLISLQSLRVFTRLRVCHASAGYGFKDAGSIAGPHRWTSSPVTAAWLCGDGGAGVRRLPLFFTQSQGRVLQRRPLERQRTLENMELSEKAII